MATEGGVGGREAGIPRRSARGRSLACAFHRRLCATDAAARPVPSAAAVSTRTLADHGATLALTDHGATLALAREKGRSATGRCGGTSQARRTVDEGISGAFPRGLAGILDLRVEECRAMEGAG